MASVTLSSECLYAVNDSQTCGRPVHVDYLLVTELHGERIVTSNCRRHSGPAADREANAKGYIRRERPGPALSVVSG